MVAGRKSAIERFAGAVTTYTIEAMMGDGRALQAGTSHNLGTNFAVAFGTRYAAPDGELLPVHQTSWGMSTRMVGGIVMAHGDDAGLRFPPAVAPVQAVFVPIVKKGADAAAVEGAVAAAAAAKAAGLRVKVDATEGKTPGWKYAHWEMKGVPVRVEVGPRDVAAGACVLVRRDKARGENKVMGVPLTDTAAFVGALTALLDDVQASMLAQATAFRDGRIVDVASYDELKAVVADGRWARGRWAGSDDDERRVKEETGATLRCFPFEQPGGEGPCLLTGAGAGEVAVFARAY